MDAGSSSRGSSRLALVVPFPSRRAHDSGSSNPEVEDPVEEVESGQKSRERDRKAFPAVLDNRHSAQQGDRHEGQDGGERYEAAENAALPGKLRGEPGETTPNEASTCTALVPMESASQASPAARLITEEARARITREQAERVVSPQAVRGEAAYRNCASLPSLPKYRGLFLDSTI